MRSGHYGEHYEDIHDRIELLQQQSRKMEKSMSTVYNLGCEKCASVAARLLSPAQDEDPGY